MTYFELILTAVGLSMDAFAVSLCRSMGQRKRIALDGGYITALLFGVFQALMPIAGYIAGQRLTAYISGIDHWIAFVILSYIGGKMIYSTLFGESEGGGDGIFELLLLCIATSIDALAVGVTLSFLSVDILFASSVIGVITFILCLFAVFLSERFGAHSGCKAELAGGIILILIALKLLLSHLGIICI